MMSTQNSKDVSPSFQFEEQSSSAPLFSHPKHGPTLFRALRSGIRALTFSALVATLGITAQADDYHYKETLIGERAAGLGGAYIAISDDPSGIWYNPAGIMFSFENYFSLSGNVYTSTTEIYKDAIAGQDYTYKSSGLVPSFFGFTQNYGKSKWGFAIVVPNDDRIDQNDQINNISATQARANTLIRRFYRQNTTTGVGVAFASEVVKNATLGLSLFGMYKTVRVIDNQLVLFNADAGNAERFEITNTSVNQDILSVYPKLGMQWMPMKELSLGATVAKKVGLTASGKINRYQTNTQNNVPAPPTGNLNTDLPRSETSLTNKDVSPTEFGLGISYFPNPDFLTAFDFTYYTADEASGMNVIGTWNIATGTEYYLDQKSALRMGFYTNNANTPDPSTSNSTLPKVDMYNLTLGYSVASEGSTFSFGTSLGKGTGKGIIVNGDPARTIERTNVSLFLTGSYQM